MSVTINSATFPDANFRNWVLNNITGGSTTLTDDQIAATTKIDIIGSAAWTNINFTGIEYFTSTTSLTLRNCTALTSMTANNTKLFTITFINSGSGALAINVTARNKFLDLTFDTCTKITSVTLTTDSGTPLRNVSFSQCSALSSVTANPNYGVGGLNFYSSCAGSLTVNANMNAGYEKAFDIYMQNCSTLTSITINNKTGLRNINIQPESTALTSLTINDSTTVNGIYVGTCPALKSVTINNCPKLRQTSCSSCPVLEFIKFNNSGAYLIVTTKDTGANNFHLEFYNCTELTGVQAYGNTALKAILFTNCPALTGLMCQNNGIMGLNLDGLAALNNINCANQTHTGIDVVTLKSLGVSDGTYLYGVDFSQLFNFAGQSPRKVTNVNAYDNDENIIASFYDGENLLCLADVPAKICYDYIVDLVQSPAHTMNVTVYIDPYITRTGRKAPAFRRGDISPMVLSGLNAPKNHSFFQKYWGYI